MLRRTTRQTAKTAFFWLLVSPLTPAAAVEPANSAAIVSPAPAAIVASVSENAISR